MTVDIEKLEALAKAVIAVNELEEVDADEYDRANFQFDELVTPATVLELIDELKRARAENKNLKSNTAGFADAFYQVADAVGVMGARSATPEQVFIDEVMPAIRDLRKDAERWRFVRNPTATGSPFAIWSERTNLLLGKFADEAIDAAMSKEASQ